MAKIAVDIDDTLYSFTDEAREVLSVMVDDPQYAPYKDQLSHALYASWDQWRTPFELCGFRSDDDDHPQRSLWLTCIDYCHDSEAILRQQPFNGSVEICNELADAGHELLYISNRARETEEATWHWLYQQGFPIGPEEPIDHKLVVTSGNKAPFIRDCQYMIDDRVKNVLEFIYDYDYETQVREKVATFEEWQREDVYNALQRKAFVRVAEYNGGLTDVPNLYLAHTWKGLRRYMVKKGLLTGSVMATA
jgi:hypothetical protein